MPDTQPDWTRIIESPDTPVDQLASALINRAYTHIRKGDPREAQAEYTRIVDLPGAPAGLFASALYCRGVTHTMLGQTDQAIADYTHLIERVPGAPIEDLASALLNRGAAWSKYDTGKALADYTHLIDLPGASARNVATALVNRGLAWSKKGDLDREFADCTYVIEQLPNPPAEQMAKALVNRGILWGEKGDPDREIADYTRVIDRLPDQTEEALRYDSDLETTPFNFGLALLACGRDAEAATAFAEAAEQYPNAVETWGLPYLLEAQTDWLTRERAQPIVGFLRAGVGMRRAAAKENSGAGRRASS
jgi:tetratricopeptide (TPR) repeat protein